MRHRWFQSLLLLSLFIQAAPSAAADEASAALDIVAARTGIAASALRVINTAVADFPLSGNQASAFKIEDPTGELHDVAIDARGNEVDGEALEEAEARAYLSTYGKLDEELFERVATARPGELIPVTLWLDVPDSEGSTRPEITTDPETPPLSPEETEALFAATDKAKQAAVGETVSAIVARLGLYRLDAEGEDFAPVVYADLPRELVAEVGGWAEVGALSLDEEGEPDLWVSRQAIGADIVEGRGIDGNGVRVGQVEIGGRVAVANPFLAGVVQDQINVCAEVSDHSTGVAGVIASTDFFDRGIGPGVALWAGGSCRGRNRQIFRRASAAADWGARAINLSFTLGRSRRPNNTDRFFDDLVQNRWRTIVKSAGNEAGPCRSQTGNITHPGLGYNVLTVGAFDTRGTPDPAGDTMWECSSWRNPRSRHDDREKPEIAAPGANIFSTTTAFPWTGPWGSGTSASAPMVTGATALLIQRNGFFAVWPETVKAALMATATHNIEGATRLSEFDGAGAVRLDLADDVASGRAGGFGGRAYSCSSPRNLDVATLNLNAGVPARVVLTWDQNPGYISYRRRPSADVDLRLLDPRGATVATSASWDNTYEIVEFTPATTGSYRLRAHKYRCNASPKWMGWAWYQAPRPPVRRGMTWAKIGHSFAFGADKFNCAGCNPFQGDALCSEAHQILCIRPDGSPNPGLPVNGNDGWIGGNVGLSPAIQGTQLLSLANANAICSNVFGAGWQMAEFHHPLGGWGWSSRGNVFAIDSSRFWVHINDQAGNCWN